MAADVWPLVIVGWKSKSDEFIEQLQKGQVDLWTGKVHARKGAPFLALLEDGRVLGTGTVESIAGKTHELALTCLEDGAAPAPLSGPLLEVLKAVPRGYLKGPLSTFLITPGKEDAPLTVEWFDAARAHAEKHLPPMIAPNAAPQPVQPATIKSERLSKSEEGSKQEVGEKEELLRSWIPPALSGLLEDHVPAAKWELMVAHAFVAIGFRVEYQGRSKPGAAPDCIARYTSPNATMHEIIIDAKAGQWNGGVDDLRAMRDYAAHAAHYANTLFVSNTLGKDVKERLRENFINNRMPGAITGRDLAQLIYQRLTNPNFNLELEIRRWFV